MRAWSSYLLVGAALAAGAILLRSEPVPTVLYLLVAFSSPAVIARVARRVRRTDPVAGLGWTLIAAGELSSALGDTAYSVLDLVLHRQPFPSVADAFYLAAYPLLGAGLVVFTGRGAISWGGRLEVAIFATSMALPLWVFVAGPVLEDPAVTALATFCDLAYPAGDLLLLALLLRLVSVRGLSNPSVRLLVVGAAMLPLADAVFSVVGDAGWLGGLSEALWLSSVLAWGAAALHPNAAVLMTGPAPDRTRVPLSRTVLLAGAALVSPAMLCAEAAGLPGAHLWSIGVASLAVVALGAVRMHLSVVQAVASLRDGERLRDEVTFHATHDPLTGLANRPRTLELLRAAQRCGVEGGLCLVVVHLDQLAVVNGVYGDAAGDEVLRAVARAAMVTVGAADRAGRLSGDEFAVWFPADDAGALTRVTAELTELPVHLASAGKWVTVSCSLGVTVQPAGRAVVAEELLREAAVAADRAEGAGGGRVWSFDEDLRAEISRRAEFEIALRQAVARDEFVLHYQPVLDLARDRVSSVEALLRWRRPGHGTVPPDEFIPVAEASDLICDIGRWVLAEATRQLAQWHRDGVVPDDLRVAVNLSGRHLARTGVLDDVRGALTASGLPPQALVVEATETVVMETGTIHDNLHQLRQLGVGLSLDDFGTGYTSIQQFRTLPMDTLKIDKSFLATSGAEAEALVSLLVHSAHAFDLRVIAEGVERCEQLAFLRSLGCDAVQGYLFSRPVPPHQVPDIVTSLLGTEAPSVADPAEEAVEVGTA